MHTTFWIKVSETRQASTSWITAAVSPIVGQETVHCHRAASGEYMVIRFCAQGLEGEGRSLLSEDILVG